MDIWYTIACFCNLNELIALRRCNKEYQKLTNRFLTYKWKSTNTVHEDAKRHMERFLTSKNSPKKIFEENVVLMIGPPNIGKTYLTRMLYPNNIKLTDFSVGDSVAMYEQKLNEINELISDFAIPVNRKNIIVHVHSTDEIPEEILLEASTMYVFGGFYFGYHFDLARFEYICFSTPDPTNNKRKHNES